MRSCCRSSLAPKENTGLVQASSAATDGEGVVLKDRVTASDLARILNDDFVSLLVSNR